MNTSFSRWSETPMHGSDSRILIEDDDATPTADCSTNIQQIIRIPEKESEKINLSASDLSQNRLYQKQIRMRDDAMLWKRRMPRLTKRNQMFKIITHISINLSIIQKEPIHTLSLTFLSFLRLRHLDLRNFLSGQF